MITTIQLSITEGPSLPASKLEKLVRIAEAAGKTPDEYLAEMISREVDEHPVKPQNHGKAA